MKKTKMFLAGLCAGALLFSAAPSFAAKWLDGGSSCKGEADTENKVILMMPRIQTYEEKVERIADYLKEVGGLSLLNLNIPHVGYGLRTVVLEGSSKANDEYIRMRIYEESTLALAIFSEPKFLLVDVKDKDCNSLYGSLDWVIKKDKEKEAYAVVTLTKEEKEKFNNLYLNIIDKFYSENEKKMDDLDKSLEQDKGMQDLFKIIEQK